MVREFNYKDGSRHVQDLLWKIASLATKPYFIGVYGHHNTGKEHLIRDIAAYLKSYEVVTHLESVNEVFVRKIFTIDELANKIHIFKCSWERDFGESQRHPILEGDIDFFLSHIGPRSKDKPRGLDFSIGMYSPAHGSPLKHPNNYSVVIRNEDAVVKGAVDVLNMPLSPKHLISKSRNK